MITEIEYDKKHISLTCEGWHCWNCTGGLQYQLMLSVQPSFFVVWGLPAMFCHNGLPSTSLRDNSNSCMSVMGHSGFLKRRMYIRKYNFTFYPLICKHNVIHYQFHPLISCYTRMFVISYDFLQFMILFVIKLNNLGCNLNDSIMYLLFPLWCVMACHVFIGKPLQTPMTENW